jgi:septal ring factor EnvC (AmiA/AmiB activator)
MQVGTAHHVCNVNSNVQEMDSELERYHKSCAALELNIGEGSLKQAGLHKELARQRSQTQDAHQAIRYVGDPHFHLQCSSSHIILLLLLDVWLRVLAIQSGQC